MLEKPIVPLRPKIYLNQEQKYLIVLLYFLRKLKTGLMKYINISNSIKRSALSPILPYQLRSSLSQVPTLPLPAHV